jgi:hypothetical protein
MFQPQTAHYKAKSKQRLIAANYFEQWVHYSVFLPQKSSFMYQIYMYTNYIALDE